MVLDCADFEHRTTFPEYISLINASTKGNLSLAAECAPQICGTLWGTGNPDISGIGAAVGYIIANILGPILTLLCIYSSTRWRKWWPAGPSHIVHDMFEAYHESALFFAFSVQIACTVVLTRATFGFSADGMGDLTVRTTWTVAALTMLPLVYRTFLFDAAMYQSPKSVHGRKRASGKESFIFPLFAVCWAVFLYTFYNRMASTFEPSQIGVIVSSEDWQQIEKICTANWQDLSGLVNATINGFGIAASLLISMLGLVQLIFEILKAWKIELRLDRSKGHLLKLWSLTRAMLWVVLPILQTGLIWSFFMLQASQNQLATALGDDDQDEEWSFGQIVSVVVFAPVMVEWLGGCLSTDISE